MIFSIVSILALGAVATALPAEEACPRTRCFDAVNKCGVKYGGCYDICTQEQPGPPPCPEEPVASTTTITSVPTPVPTPPSSSLSSISDCTKTGTACVDYLRTCGSPPTAVLTYGGCFPACGPTPTYTPPPCSEATVTEAAEPAA
ncbi:hypothetical protein F5Y06DRAFT_140012 [Hypoxylon sp. FL0890]|nr:hypothetical protein F5Y06DRAFT_140012 [Hypoxylon sp. FL0890]